MQFAFNARSRPADGTYRVVAIASRSFRARWVFPVDRAPIEDGVVTIADGRIVSVGRGATDPPAVDLGNVAITPGLVNAHTHLEFSELTEPLLPPQPPFTDWVRALLAYRRPRTAADHSRAIAKGLAESAACGVTTIGEIARPSIDSIQATAKQSDIGVVNFFELIGPTAERAQQTIADAESLLSIAAAGGKSLVGLSPHAPYTVHPELFDYAVEQSRRRRFPLAMHLAETREELLAMGEGRGPLSEMLAELGAWSPETMPRGAKPLDYLRRLAEADRALVIHGNYLSDEEIDFVAAHRNRLSVVYCPRTHAYFGHEPYPLEDLILAGARVALGTDSRASNPDLDVFAELRHVARNFAVSRETALAMGTLWGAEALGLAAECGSLTPGKSGHLAVFQLPESPSRDAHELLFDPTTRSRSASESPRDYGGRF